eukprot:scaffold1893_cov166-Skeletonema_dohrnii-CCMP3373.AAC.2
MLPNLRRLDRGIMWSIYPVSSPIEDYDPVTPQLMGVRIMRVKALCSPEASPTLRARHDKWC